MQRITLAIRAALIDAREGAGLTQRELAEAVGVEQKTVWRTESGERHVRLADVILWTPAMKTTPEAFLARVVEYLEDPDAARKLLAHRSSRRRKPA